MKKHEMSTHLYNLLNLFFTEFALVILHTFIRLYIIQVKICTDEQYVDQ